MSVDMIAREFKQINPSLEAVQIETLRHRLCRWMKSENIVQRKATQVAQNIWHNKEINDDFVTYVD